MCSALLLSSCGSVAAPTGTGAGQGRAGPEGCAWTRTSLPLLGIPGDSPIVPVQVDGRQLAMFFSPGFVPLLFRSNGSVSFERFRRVDLRQQDGDELPAYTSVARGLSVGDLKPADRKGYLLPEPDDRDVDGRPVVGMLGRDVLPKDAVVELDVPGRRIGISSHPDDCAGPPRSPPARSIGMQQEVLLVPVRINGRPVQAVLEPDLPVSILPRAVANGLGISDADLANDPSVVTRFGRGVLGRRHRVATLVVGDTRLSHFAFDVEGDVGYAMLGLNLFDLGRGTFDFANQRFLFEKTGDVLPPSTDMHFDRTRVAHVGVDE